jgi:hypothetical protein
VVRVTTNLRLQTHAHLLWLQILRFLIIPFIARLEQLETAGYLLHLLEPFLQLSALTLLACFADFDFYLW